MECEAVGSNPRLTLTPSRDPYSESAVSQCIRVVQEAKKRKIFKVDFGLGLGVENPSNITHLNPLS